MSTRDIPVNVDINIRARARGEEEVQTIVRTLEMLKEAGADQITVNLDMARGYEYTRGSSVRMALSLRSLSIGLMILRRELGGISPTIDALIQGMYLTGGAVTTAYSAMRIYEEITKESALSIAGLGRDLGRLKGWLVGASTSATIFIGILAALAGIEIWRWLYRAEQGIGAMRREIKELEEGLEELKLVLSDVNIAQGEIGYQSQFASAQLAQLRYEEEMLGYATPRMTEEIKALERQMMQLGVQSDWVAAMQAAVGLSMDKTQDKIDDQTKSMETSTDTWKDWGYWIERELPQLYKHLTGLPAGPVGPAATRFLGEFLPHALWLGLQRGIRPPWELPGAQIGGEVRRGGAVEVHAGEIIAQREPLLQIAREVREVRETQREIVRIQQPATPGVIREMQSVITETPIEQRPMIEVPAIAAGVGGPIQVDISFPNAVFQGEMDLRAALREGGREAGYEFRRGMELDRHRVRGR